jgi:hypothetical protein
MRRASGCTWRSPSLHATRIEPETRVQMKSSVADPDPNPGPPDPHVFGPPGSGSISQRYGSGFGFGSFYHQAKIIKKTLIFTAL